MKTLLTLLALFLITSCKKDQVYEFVCQPVQIVKIEDMPADTSFYPDFVSDPMTFDEVMLFKKFNSSTISGYIDDKYFKVETKMLCKVGY